MKKNDFILNQSGEIFSEKTYIRKNQIVVLFIVVFIFLFIIFLSYIGTKDLGILLISGVFFGFLDLMFILILIITYKQKLIINKDEIIFYYKTFSSYKAYRKINLRGLHIKFDDIESITCRTQYGDGFVIANTKFVGFILKNGKDFETTFFHFGKKQEEEILTILKYINDKKKEDKLS